MVVRKPTLPKLTPTAGTVVPSSRRSARSIVPSPPRTTTMSASEGSPSATSMSCFSSSSAGMSSSTPALAEHTCSRSSASPPVSRRPWVMTAARCTGSGIERLGDPAVECVRQLRSLTLDELEEELTISLRPRQPGIHGRAGLGSPTERSLRDLAQHAPVNLAVAHDAAARDLRLPRLELQLDEDERLPAGRGKPEHGRKNGADADEGHVARDEVRCEWELVHVACVRPLEDGDPAVCADAWIELAVADVERDHARRAALEQHVGEPARRRADVEAAETGN